MTRQTENVGFDYLQFESTSLGIQGQTRRESKTHVKGIVKECEERCNEEYHR